MTRMTGDEAIGMLRKVLQCERSGCKECPLAVDENDTDCASYAAMLVLDADWSDCSKQRWGMMPLRMTEGGGADAV